MRGANSSDSRLLEEHRNRGRSFVAAGVSSFVRDEGSGPLVVFVHGMWGASFLYRKVLAELARDGVRGLVWDLPGFGLADRPGDFDYSWTGLGEFSVAAVDALGLQNFHLVVHDVGGPVGFELAAALPDQVQSLTVLNTMIDVTGFRPPWSMRPLRRRWLGPLYLRTINPAVFRTLMRLQGVSDTSKVSSPELDALLALMRREDGGRGFLRAMRAAERTDAKQSLYRSVVSSNKFPVQIIWTRDDPALPLATYGRQAREAAGVEPIVIPGKHFPQEDQYSELAGHISRFVLQEPEHGLTAPVSG